MIRLCSAQLPRDRQIACGLFWALAALTLPGCYRSNPPVYNGPLVAVSGSVTLDSQPLADVTVSFGYSGSEPPHGFMGGAAKTDSTGKFQLRSGGKIGIPPGRYVVALEKYVGADGRPFREDPENGMDLEQLRMSGSLQNQIPEKYRPGGAAEFTIEISPNQTEPVVLALVSK